MGPRVARLVVASLALAIVACSGGDAAPDAGTSPGGPATPAPSAAGSSSAASSSSAAPALTHEPGTVPTAAPKKEPTPEEQKLPPVEPKLETLAAQPTPRKASKDVAYAGWLDETHLTIPSPGRMEILSLPSGAGVSITTGSRITAFAGNAEHLATLDESARLVVWELASKTPPRHWAVEPMKNAWDPTPTIALSPDGARVAHGRDAVVVWDVATGKELTRIARDVPTFELLLTKDEVLVSSNNVAVDAFRIADGKPSGSAGFETGATFGVTFSPDGKWGAGAAPAGHGMEVADIHHEGQRHQLVNVEDCAHHVNVGFSRDSRHAYAYLGSDWVKGFHTGTWKPYASYRASPGRVIAGTSDDLGHVLTTKDGLAPTIVVVANKKETPLEHPLEGQVGYAMSPDGAMVLGTDDKHAIRVWSSKTGKVVYEIVP